jgi:hypothetical protein
MALRDLSEMSLRRKVQEHMNRILRFYRLSDPLQVSGCSYAVALSMFPLLTSYSDICTQCSISQLFYFCFLSGSSKQLTILRTFRRISKGSDAHSTKGPITLLRDSDQPFIFDITFFNRPYRFEFYDTSSPDNWTLLQPHVIVLCYDISSRLSLINIQRLASHPVPISLHHLLIFFFISVEKRSHENIHTGERDSNINAWFEKRSSK